MRMHCNCDAATDYEQRLQAPGRESRTRQPLPSIPSNILPTRPRSAVSQTKMTQRAIHPAPAAMPTATHLAISLDALHTHIRTRSHL